MEEKKATIVIPNYNGKRFLKKCLESIEAQTCNCFETLVIDNASSDGSVEYIRSEFPWVKVHVNRRNLGFAGGVNIGIRLCTTPYVLLLNNDTESSPEFVEEMIKAIEASDDIFSVSSRMVQYHNRALLDDTGDLYTVLGWGIQRGVGQKVSGYKEPADVFSACAGAAIYRKYMLDRIGYFDEMHFAYLEDIDLGYRARIFGWRNVYCPTAVVYHVGSGTSGSKYNSFKVKLSARNSVYLNYKNMPLLQLLVNLPFLTVGCLIKYRFFRSIGYGSDYLDGLKNGIRTCRRCKKVFFQGQHLKNYVRIEWDLWKNTWIYVQEFVRRKILN